MRDDKVVALRAPDRAPDPGEVHQGCVLLLRDALARAERGDIQSIVIAYADAKGNTGRMYDGVPPHILYALKRAEIDIMGDNGT